jgi:small subunit ribosomal protein S20
MPNTKSAKKSLRQDQRRRQENSIKKRNLRELLKNIKKMIKDNQAAEAQKLLPDYDRAVDKAAKTNVIKKNTAARKKSGIRRLFKG